MSTHEDQLSLEIEREREQFAQARVLAQTVAEILVNDLPMIGSWGGDQPFDGFIGDLQRRVNALGGWERREPAPGKAKPKQLSVTESLNVHARCGYRCVCCGTQDNLTVDHIIAVSNGGTNSDENLQTLCRSCNSSKGDRRACVINHSETK